MFKYPCPECASIVSVKPTDQVYGEGSVIMANCKKCGCEFGISLGGGGITARADTRTPKQRRDDAFRKLGLTDEQIANMKD